MTHVQNVGVVILVVVAWVIFGDVGVLVRELGVAEIEVVIDERPVAFLAGVDVAVG